MPAKNVGAEIKHLQSKKGYPHKRAVAASLNMARKGKFGGQAKPAASKGLRALYREG